MYLLARSGHVSGEQIGRHLGVSAKTVYRLVREINQAPGGEIIEATRGLGYRLNHAAYLRLTHGDVAPGESLSRAERRKRILKDLLSESPGGVEMGRLCDQYFISESQLRADVRMMQGTISPYGLELIQRHNSLFVEGRETGIRTALSDLLQVDHVGTLVIAEESLHGPSQVQDMEFARSQVDFITESLGSAVPPPYDINLATHLFVMIARTRLRKLDDHGGESKFLVDREDPAQRRYWEVALNVRRNLEEYLGTPVPAVETDYVFAYINSSRIEGPAAHVRAEEDLATRFVRELAEEMSHELEVNLATHRLIDDLALHVRPMLNRLRYGLRVTNPVLGQLEQAYPGLIARVGAAANHAVSRHDLPDVSVDEVGHMALYFARELELRATRVRALITCSSGIGTSELLRVKTEKAFPEIEVIDVVSAAAVQNTLNSEASIDIVITSVGLPFDLGVPVVLVDAMLSTQSQDRVREALRDLA